MTYAAKDLSTLHDCQDIVERGVASIQTLVRAKLLTLTTEDGIASAKEFDELLKDHIADLQNDTLDAWAITKKSEVEGGEWNVPSIAAE